MSPFLLAIFCVFCPGLLVAQKPTWPPLPGFEEDGSCICPDGSVCVTVPSSKYPDRKVCPPPECRDLKVNEVHEVCLRYECKENGYCDEWVEKALGEHCFGHYECGLDKVCNGQCVDLPEAYVGSTMTKCSQSLACNQFEKCLPDPGHHMKIAGWEGVCIMKIGEPAAKKQLEALLNRAIVPYKGHPVENNIRRAKESSNGLNRAIVPYQGHPVENIIRHAKDIKRTGEKQIPQLRLTHNRK